MTSVAHVTGTPEFSTGKGAGNIKIELVISKLTLGPEVQGIDMGIVIITEFITHFDHPVGIVQEQPAQPKAARN